MVVKIKEDIFRSEDFKGLNSLVQILTYKQRYDLFVEFTVIKDTVLFKRLDEDDRKEIEEFYNKIIQEGKDAYYTISFSCKDKMTFNIEEAIRFFQQPVSVILENSLNDKYFILAVVRNFDTSKQIIKHLNEGWIEFGNAGGCGGVVNLIKEQLQKFDQLPSVDKAKYLRCTVLLDSDKEYPTAPTKAEYSSLIEFLDENNILHHILTKRSMENYLPSEVYFYNSDFKLNDWISAYQNLNEVQKDYLNIYQGFSVKNNDGTSKFTREQIKQEVQDLYSDLSDANWNILDKGFKISNFKTEFPKYFEHHQVHKMSLQSRAGVNNELKEIIQNIVQLL